MITMPVPPSDSSPDFMYYQAFMHAMNSIDQTCLATRIFEALERAAQRTETSSAHLARLFVSYGMRAPAQAFPESFRNYAESYIRTLNDNPSLSMSQHHDIIELHSMWQQPAASYAASATEHVVAA